MLGALPVFWVREPVYLAICVAVSAATFFLAHIPDEVLSRDNVRDGSFSTKFCRDCLLATSA